MGDVGYAEVLAIIIRQYQFQSQPLELILPEFKFSLLMNHPDPNRPSNFRVWNIFSYIIITISEFYCQANIRRIKIFANSENIIPQIRILSIKLIHRPDSYPVPCIIHEISALGL